MCKYAGAEYSRPRKRNSAGAGMHETDNKRGYAKIYRRNVVFFFKFEFPLSGAESANHMAIEFENVLREKKRLGCVDTLF